MPEAIRLALAFLASCCGMAWLALAMKAHWQQVRGPTAPPPGTRWRLRIFGAAALAVSLALCLAVDHVSMASLVFVMTLAASALLVALTLSFRPRALAWLAPRGR